MLLDLVRNAQAASAPPSRLLSLPAEIRALIFTYAVACEQRVTFRLDTLQQQYYSAAVQPALTRVSRQVRAESLPLYYEANDFVLHTDGFKADDARRWLACNAAGGADWRRLSLWLRYVPPASERSPGSGALEVSLVRPHRADVWAVDERWRWITVTRKPADLATDAAFLLEKLRELLAPRLGRCTATATPQEYFDLMMDLRVAYMVHKKTAPPTG